MRPFRSTLALLVPAALALTGATCTRGPAPTAVSTSASAEGSEHAAPVPASATDKPLAGKVLPEVAGMDFSSLPPEARAELAQVFSDEFCYCGCPHTLGACLTTHASCRHAKRMARLAAGEAAAGASGLDIINLLGRYYASFRAKRAVLPVDAQMCQGPQDAPVTLVEFSDFQCPYCAAARPLLEAFAKSHSDQVRLCYAPFPLEGHPFGLPAAQAVLAARDAGKFWEMHDALFENSAQLSGPKIQSLAEGLGVGPAVKKALEARTHLDELERSKNAGRAAGVTATPTVFVNGRKLELPLTEAALAHTVEDELEWAPHSGWAQD